MTVHASVTIKPTMSGKLGTFLQSFDVNGLYTDMRQFGNWTTPGNASFTGPYVVNLAPASGSGTSASFTFNAGHSRGVDQLSMVHLLIAPNIVNGDPCQVLYFPTGNTVNLINDDGSALVAPGFGLAPGAGQSISNSRCTVNLAAAARYVAGTNVSVTLPMTFNASTFAGAKNVYLNAFDNSGILSHWMAVGTWSVQ